MKEKLNYAQIKPKKELKAILLDFDGTLVNTEKPFYNSFKRAIKKEFNIEITFKDYKENELDKNAYLIEYLKKEGRINTTTTEQEFMPKVYTQYKKHLLELTLSEEEIKNFESLNKIKLKGIKLGLVSTSKKVYIDIILNKLNINNLFDIIISRDDVVNLKPAPDAYLKAVEKLNVNSNNCLAIEDANRGIESAQKAGIKVLKTDQFNREENKDNFELIIDKVSDLSETLKC